MYYSISGSIIALSEELLILECHGVAYEINISKQSYGYFFEAHKGELASQQPSNQKANHNQHRCYTWLHATDKGMTLYGFYSLAERSVFITLLKVDGIGPKAAIKILSYTKPEDIISYIKAHDTSMLSKIPGIGAKKASKILLALEDVYIAVQTPQTSASTVSKASMNASATPSNDIINGLIKMGYARGDVEFAYNLLIDKAADDMAVADDMAESVPTTATTATTATVSKVQSTPPKDLDEGLLMQKIILLLETNNK